MIKSPLLKTVKKALRDQGHGVPYLSELSKADVHTWMARYLSEEQRANVLQSATAA